MSFQSDVLTLERDGHVATVWLDRPERRNAMGVAFFQDLPRALAEIDDDADVRAVVIAARGDHFTYGLDLKEMGGLLTGMTGAGGGTEERSSTATRNLTARKAIKRIQQAVTAVEDCRVPTIAAVHGWCIGGGVDLITGCDIRLASADATFSVRETKVGIVADVGTLQRLPRVIGRGQTAELVYTGRDVDADHAERIGLVNHVHPDVDAVHKAAHELAAEIAANSPIVVEGARTVLRAGESLTVEQGLEYVALWNTAFLQSNDLLEAMAAFMEKRDPHFDGT